MMKRKVFCWFLAASLLILSSCAKSESGQTAPAAGGGEATEDDLSQRIKMVIMMGKQFDVPPGNSIEKLLGEKINADIEFRLVSRATQDLINNLNMIIASGDYPDIIQFEQIAMVNKYVEEGILLPLDELLKKYGPEILAIRTDTMFEVSTFDGKKMAIPITDNTSTSVPIIRKDWLEKLGLPIPATMEEYENCLKAFTENDPDGNGKKDTYGISGTNNLPTEVFSQVFAYYGVPPNISNGVPDSWVVRDGKLVNGAVSPEMLDALKHINKWYNAGWVDPEFPLYSRDKFQEIIGTGTFGSYAWQTQRLDPAFDISLAALYKKEPGALFISFPPVKDKNGNPGKLYHGDNRSYNFIGLSKTCVSPQRAVMLMNYVASEEGYLRIRYGVEGTNYVVENGLMKWINGYDDINKRTQEGLSIQYNNFVRREFVDRMIDKTTQEAFAMMNANMVSSSPLFVTTPSMLEHRVLQRQLEVESFIKLMTAPPGTNVNAIWDDYVTRWYRDVGGQKMTDEINELYAKRS
jgi:putative aldouronate transport system substrate-binding protein